MDSVTFAVFSRNENLVLIFLIATVGNPEASSGCLTVFLGEPSRQTTNPPILNNKTTNEQIDVP